ncbi:MAG: hypothetical protein K2H30_05410 [Clostridia bacterium]|nr:hypothetical protein [Clostridia bacterium]
MHKKCYSCAYFKDYYFKTNCRFMMSGSGYCSNQNKKISRHSTCPQFKRRAEKPINSAAVFEELEDTLTRLNGIKTILEEHEEF